MFKVVFVCILSGTLVLSADQGYLIQTVAGTSDAGDNGPATGALLVQAEGIAIDGAGNIYVTDAGDNRVRKINAHGMIQTIAGTGSAGFSGDGAAAISAQLNHPYGIALDLAGNVYVADLGNARVRKIDTAGVITTIAGGGTAAVTSGAAVAAIEAMLTSPRNIAVDNLNNVYISDFNAHRVYQVAPSGALTVLTGTGLSGMSGDGGAAALAQVSYPAGLATDAIGNVFISDSGNGRLRRVWRGIITTVATGVPSATGVSVDASGRVYAASPGAASTSRAPSTAGLNVEIVSAEDVASDPGGTLFLVNAHSVQKMIGTASTVIAGAAIAPTYGDGGPATKARLDGPVAMALNSGGEIFLAEQSASRIRKITANGTITTMVADPAQAGGTSGIAVDAAGTVFFADTANNRVRRISAGSVVSVVADKLNGPACMRMGPAGSLYVCDKGNDRILKITAAGSITTAANVSKPSGLAVGNDGALYASTGSQVVQVPLSGGPTIVADGLSSPAGLALTSSGELMIAESGKHRILKVGAMGTVTVIAGTGQAGFGGDGGAAAAAQLNNPTDAAIDSTGNLLIADTGNNRIRKLTPAPAEAPAPVVAPPAPVTLAPLTIVNAASQISGPVARNEIITIYGSGFDSDHTQVTFDGAAATIFFAGARQLNVLVPMTLHPGASSTVDVMSNGTPAGTAVLNVAPAVFGLFTVSNGLGQAAALNQDGTINSASNPAARGSIIVLFATGDGADGSPVSVQIAGYSADVLYAGPAPGYPGLVQINARVPAGFLPTGALPVAATVGAASSQPGVTIAVQ